MRFIKRYIFRIFVIMFLMLEAQMSYGQNKIASVSSQEYYDFFNSFINPDSIHNFNLENKPDFTHILNDTTSIFSDSSLFTAANIDFIRIQISTSIKFKWKSGKILGSKVISSKEIASFFKTSAQDEGWRKFNRKYKNGFSTFSIPLFSLNKKTCIVYEASHCGGLCGYGGIGVYKKINDKWTYLKKVGMVWIS